jgi:hypothetical protein
MLPHFSDHLEFALKLLRHNLQPTLLARLVGVRAELITSPISFRPLHRVGKREGAGPLFALWNPVIPNSRLIIKKRR